MEPVAKTIQMYQGWEEFFALPISQKLETFSKDGRLFDIIWAQQFNRAFLDYSCQLASKIRNITKTKTGMTFLQSLLNHKRAMLYFVQPSTRTFLSFMSACQILGIKVADVRGTSTSSEVKGESSEDTMRTFASYEDLIIIRHPEAGFAEKTAWVLNHTDHPVPVINGGSGPDQHPSQALLDIYTLQRAFAKRGGLDGKSIAMVGDLGRGRTVRSLTYLMKNYKNVTLYFVSPEIFRINEDMREFLRENDIAFVETSDFKSVMPKVDAIYMTRIQKEYAKDPSQEEDIYPDFHFTAADLKHIQGHTVIMHPLPRRYEIEVAVDNDPRAVYWEQEHNGMWMRTALIAYIFGVDNQVMDY